MSNPQLDLSGLEVKQGDWIVQPEGKGEIKLAYVVGFAKTSGNIRAVSFYWGRKYRKQADGKYAYDNVANWVRLGPYTIQNSERTFVTDTTRVNKELLDHIEVDLKGDPLYDPEDGHV